MNPDNRVIVRITIEDAEKADEAFTILMGDQVEPRGRFIETNAQYAKLDVCRNGGTNGRRLCDDTGQRYPR